LVALTGEDLFTVRRFVTADGPLLALVGEVDAYTAPDLRRALDAELHCGSHPLVLDLAHLTFIDGSGLRVIEWAVTAFAPRPVEIRNARPVVRQLAAIIGLDARAVFVGDGVPRASHAISDRLRSPRRVSHA